VLPPNYPDQAMTEECTRQILSYIRMARRNTYIVGLLDAFVSRRAFITSDRCIEMGPFAMEEGDMVVIFFGGTVPYVSRPRGVHYLLVRESAMYMALWKARQFAPSNGKVS
jgi:hypothetical protein